MPSPREDLSTTLNSIHPSPSSCDAFAVFAQLGGGNSILSNPHNDLAPSPSLSFSELTNDEFMQMLEPNDLTVTAGTNFGFETFADIADIPAGPTTTDAIQTSDNAFSSPSELDASSSSSSSDFLSFDFSSSTTSVTPSSSISSGLVSEYAHHDLSPPIQSTKAFCTEPSAATEDELRVYSASVPPIASKGWVANGEIETPVYLFFSAFIPYLPIVHEPTWREDDKPPVLIRVMQACGALFVRTRPATQFVTLVLATAREEIIHEYVCHFLVSIPARCLPISLQACKMNDSHRQAYLILAFALLQTLRFSNQHAYERRVANVYHGTLKMVCITME